jgi:hypothetical protein
VIIRFILYLIYYIHFRLLNKVHELFCLEEEILFKKLGLNLINANAHTAFGVSLITRYRNNEHVVYIIVNIEKDMLKDKTYFNLLH